MQQEKLHAIQQSRFHALQPSALLVEHTLFACITSEARAAQLLACRWFWRMV